jgi:polyvinyl alcohol dehydrogenase (cytochrome)
MRLLRVLISAALLCQGLANAQDGAALYDSYCSTCHDDWGDARAPSTAVLSQMTPEQILTALEKGSMRRWGADRTRNERRALAQFLSGKQLDDSSLPAMATATNCRLPPAPLRQSLDGPGWNGWGSNTANTRFQPPQAAHLSENALTRLKLKWAFGFPGATSASSQPVVMGGRVYLSSWEGQVYSLDARTGCTIWHLEVDSGVRSAVSLGLNAAGQLVVYFGDLAANAYAVEAATGKIIWKTKVDNLSLARITGSPTLHNGLLYVPVSSREESSAIDSRYECCRFRGSVAALNAATGQIVWKTYTVEQAAQKTQKTRAGVQSWGPSGAAVWVAND